MSETKQSELFVVVSVEGRDYYLLKVVRRDSDVYCIPPHLGIHHSLHESGEAHFRSEQAANRQLDELPVILTTGEAGVMTNNGLIQQSIRDAGRAICVCTLTYDIRSVESDFREFARIPKQLFRIDKNGFAIDATGLEIGVWAVPSRNKVSFEFNNAEVRPELVHKVSDLEPQLWVYARSF